MAHMSFSNLTESYLTNSSQSSGWNINSASVWKLEDYAGMACLFVAIVIASMLFHFCQNARRRVWAKIEKKYGIGPGTARFQNIIEEQHPEQFTFEREQGINVEIIL